MLKDYCDRLILLNDELLSVSNAKIGVLSPSTQFGANVFEGIRCYWNEKNEQLYAFRLLEHHKRLKQSIRLMKFEDKFSIQKLKESFLSVIYANNYKEDIAVRQTIFLDGAGTWSSSGPVGMFVAPIPKKRGIAGEIVPLKCCVSTWRRIDDNILPPRAKVGANYMNSRLLQLEALERGCDTGIFMNSLGKVAEGPGSCIFILRNGELSTPQRTCSILESITRSTVIELAEKKFNLRVTEREIDRTELYLSEEVFMVGSAMEIRPVGCIDGYEVPSSDLAVEMQRLYVGIASGETYFNDDWITPVY